jgi:HlyD family secretion protein
MFSRGTRRQVVVLAASLVLCAGCKSSPEVRVVPVVKAHVEATVSSVNSGTVRAERITSLAFGTVGRVKEVNFKLGDAVREGEILAQVENDDLKSRLQSAQEEYERSQRLSKSDAMSQSGVTQARANYDAAKTSYEKSLIKAPYDGVIAELNLEVGELSQITAVIPQAPIRIVDLEPRYVRAEIDEVDLPKVKVGLPARVKILAVRKEPFKATVRKVVPFVSSVREQDRTSEIELDVDNEGVLLPAGASADVEVITDTKDDVVTVSSKALLGRGSDRYVYVLNGTRLKKIPVQIGIYGYTVSEVKSGLSLSDEVVLPSDKFEVSDGLRVKVRR